MRRRAARVRGGGRPASRSCVSWRGGALDRLLDERHAALVGVTSRDDLRATGWQVELEVTFNHVRRPRLDRPARLPRQQSRTLPRGRGQDGAHVDRGDAAPARHRRQRLAPDARRRSASVSDRTDGQAARRARHDREPDARGSPRTRVLDPAFRDRGARAPSLAAASPPRRCRAGRVGGLQFVRHDSARGGMRGTDRSQDPHPDPSGRESERGRGPAARLRAVRARTRRTYHHPGCCDVRSGVPGARPVGPHQRRTRASGGPAGSFPAGPLPPGQRGPGADRVRGWARVDDRLVRHARAGPQVAVDRRRGALAVAHGQDDRRRAADDVAAGEDAGDATSCRHRRSTM